MNNLENIAQELAASADKIIARKSVRLRALDHVPAGFVPFTTGALGNFPYYWLDPINHLFNYKTYDWIRAHLKANTTPVLQAGIFTNLYIDVFSDIIYSLSKADQNKLKKANKKIEKRQDALIKKWRRVYGSLPPGNDPPIDLIIQKITQTWASPPTTLLAMQETSNLQKLLNQTPASGEVILRVLSNYLNALDNCIPLLNATTMNTGYITRALKAAQRPTVENGGLRLNNEEIQPAYTVSPSVAKILAGLNSVDNKKAFTLKMSVARASSKECSVSIKGRAPLKVPFAEFLNVTVGSDSDFFEKHIAINPTEVNVIFAGVTDVYFGPVNFSTSTKKNWYWPIPIRNAIENVSRNVTGFKFALVPLVDFSKSGPFGFLTGVAISKTPSFKIKAKGPNYKEIARHLQAVDSAMVTFLNTPMGKMNVLSKDQDSVVTNDKDNSVTLNLRPAPEVADDNVNSTAYVLGVQTNLPASDATS